MPGTDPSKLIVTFTASQWYCMPEAMQKMGEVIHGEDMPVTWQVNFATAREEQAILDLLWEAKDSHFPWTREDIKELIKL